MSDYPQLGEMVKERISEVFTLTKEDLGSDARLSKKGMTFMTEGYKVEGLGHLCIMKMNAMMGLMKMETVVLSVTEKDLPLFNLDWVSAMGKETQMAELYDTQLEPLTEDALAGFQVIKDRDSELPDYSSGSAHWYDDILYPCSYAKTGKGLESRMNAAAQDYLDQYMELVKAAPDCDSEAKRAKVGYFANTLFTEGGPAVDQVKNLFGDEIAGRLILKHMYGIDQER
ncbi:MAG: hypothetical protein IKX81_04570 [Firmicutes bacterium]|nr:hypothetical protein [Bacillota bacterium]